MVVARLSERSKLLSSFCFFEGFCVTTTISKEELKTWRIATYVMVTLSAFFFLIQRLTGLFSDVIFEFCIFYIPTFAIIGFLLYFRTKSN